ncbi:MAG: transcriptional regulator NrdR [Candidatus Wallbacteria bacterium]|nr:transcriptional regulator NrdR [Candidatus Wallbacteria bacterium]
MKCPYCNLVDSKVIETREFNNHQELRRRRECLSCGRRYTTREKCVEVLKSVVKNDGRREEFSLEKVRKGIERACEKRPVSSESIDALVNGIEHEITLLQQKEVESRVVGEMVMQSLKKLDEVAYIRFASVYKQFKDVAEFAREIESIKNENISRRKS